LVVQCAARWRPSEDGLAHGALPASKALRRLRRGLSGTYGRAAPVDLILAHAGGADDHSLFGEVLRPQWVCGVLRVDWVVLDETTREHAEPAPEQGGRA